jgi:hypothetical protein
MLTVALAFNMLHFMYHQLTLHFDFYPFNNIHAIPSGRRMIKSLAGGLLALFPLISLRSGNLILIEMALVLLVVMVSREFWLWWVPYLTRPSEEWRNWYQQVFRETVRVLPPIRDNPIPNLEHCILHLLILSSLFSTMIFYAFIQGYN